ncbi:hypothetical protein GRF29_1536g187778 [Pseudopithomyces chartarum]|uniref:Major facilitator superfamily (MFS) profile domain-containing protein n=1 Tax=Pseudopithomyces chartarum TaxID=1892770 RepID=A0AAN6LMI9_9PLEO|nr:hypothetical protein GRF29_1536g187778 [Pseudopithomyces chartarum]
MDSETSPLLPGSGSPPPPGSPRTTHDHDHDAQRCTGSQDAKLYPYTVILVGLFSLVADMGGSMVDTPDVRMLEMAVCRDYYRSHNATVIGPPPQSYVPEKLCKVPQIQNNLAYLRAIRSLLMTIPGLLLTLPYGRLADRIGRKPVMLLGMTGQVLNYFWVLFICYFHEILPTRAVLISPMFLAIGGGVRVLSAMVNALVVDVCPPEMRTTVFYLIGAVVLLTDVVAAPIGSWLLSKDLWLPYWFSTPIILMGYPIILLMPETASAIKNPHPSSLTHDENSGSDSSDQATTSASLVTNIRTRVKESLGAFAISKEITLCLVVIFLNSFSSSSGNFFIQYVSNLLDWPIARTGYLLSIKAAVLLGLLLVLATLTRFANLQGSSRGLNVDVWVTRTSLMLLVLGNLVLGLGKNTAAVIIGAVVTTGGNGIVQAMQGIVASLARSSSVTGQLYAGVALAELTAALIGGLAFAGLFNLGMNSGSETGLGLPFIVSAMLFLITFGISFFIPAGPRARTT